MTASHAAWRVAAIASIVVTVVVVALDAIDGSPSIDDHAMYGIVTIVFAVVGWLIVERRPGNAIGPLMVVFAAAFASYLLADLYVSLPGPSIAADWAALFISTLDAPMFTVLGLTLVLFPDGRPLPGRWSLAIPLAAASIVAGVAAAILAAGPIALMPRFVNPIGLPGFPARTLLELAYVGMLALLVLAVASLVTRWRRGFEVEREQIKWVALATVVVLVAEIANVLTFRPEDPTGVVAVIAGLSIALVPISMGVAILHYRLYEIDRIISRTIAYAWLTAVLGAVFVAMILLLQAVLQPFTQGQTVAIAASTLVAAALFQPLRGRVQHVVDRRFDRARFDAERTSAAFAERLRHEVDIETVRTDLRRTVDRSIRPSSIDLWIREPVR